MKGSSNIKFRICFIDSELDAEHKDEQVQFLMTELNDMDEVETVTRVIDPNPPEGNKALGSFLAELLMAEVNASNAKKLINFLGDRLSGKPIELEVEADGKRLKVSAHSQEELEAAIKAAKDFMSV